MANKKNTKDKKISGKKKMLIFLIVIVFLGGGGYIGYMKYMAYQKQLAQQKQKEEELRKQKLVEEQKRKALEQATKQLAELIAQMREALKKGNYSLVRELAEKARKIALVYNLSVEEIDKILKEMNLAIAMAQLSKLEKIDDIYAYLYVRSQLKKIPKYPEIAARWERLWRKTFQNEYIVLLELSEITSKKASEGDSSEINYTLSKSYLKKAKSIAASGMVRSDINRENAIGDVQSQAYISNIGRSFHPVSLYR